MARSSVGDIRVLDEEQGGVDVERSFESSDFRSADRRVDLDLSVGIGQVVVERG